MKKLFCVLLAVMCLFSFTACGGGDNAGTAEGGESDVVTVKLGGSGPLTGGAAVYGEAVYNAAKLAVEEINASDSKIKFDLKFEDDEADPEKSPTAYNVLYDWGMEVSLFTVTSGAGAAVASMYDEDQIFAITPSGSSTDLVYTSSKNYTGNFQMCFTDPNMGIVSADYIAKNFAGKKVGIIYNNEDVYSSGIYEKFVGEAKIVGVDVVDAQSFAEGASDFNAQLDSVKAKGAEIVYLPIYYQPASLILTQAKAKDYAPTFIGVDGMDGILDLEGFDTALAEGVYLLTPFDANASDDLTVHFVTEFKKAYGGTPNQFAADAYDCVYAIKAALENIGVANIKSCDLYSELKSQFLSMTYNGVTGMNMTWGENGEISKEPKAVMISGGVYVSVE